MYIYFSIVCQRYLGQVGRVTQVPWISVPEVAMRLIDGVCRRVTPIDMEESWRSPAGLQKACSPPFPVWWMHSAVGLPLEEHTLRSWCSHQAYPLKALINRLVSAPYQPQGVPWTKVFLGSNIFRQQWSPQFVLNWNKLRAPDRAGQSPRTRYRKSTRPRLVHAFVTSKLYNSIYSIFISFLAELPQCLLDKDQRTQNAGARLVSCTCKYEQITPVHKELHWLPVKQRIIFKIFLFTYKALKALAPQYFPSTLHWFPSTL